MTESKSVVHYVTPKRTHTRHLLEMTKFTTHISPRPDKIGIQSNWGFVWGQMPNVQVWWGLIHILPR